MGLWGTRGAYTRCPRWETQRGERDWVIKGWLPPKRLLRTNKYNMTQGSNKIGSLNILRHLHLCKFIKGGGCLGSPVGKKKKRPSPCVTRVRRAGLPGPRGKNQGKGGLWSTVQKRGGGVACQSVHIRIGLEDCGRDHCGKGPQGKGYLSRTVLRVVVANGKVRPKKVLQFLRRGTQIRESRPESMFEKKNNSPVK